MALEALAAAMQILAVPLWLSLPFRVWSDDLPCNLSADQCIQVSKTGLMTSQRFPSQGSTRRPSELGQMEPESCHCLSAARRSWDNCLTFEDPSCCLDITGIILRSEN